MDNLEEAIITVTENQTTQINLFKSVLDKVDNLKITIDYDLLSSKMEEKLKTLIESQVNQGMEILFDSLKTKLKDPQEEILAEKQKATKLQ